MGNDIIYIYIYIYILQAYGRIARRTDMTKLLFTNGPKIDEKTNKKKERDGERKRKLLLQVPTLSTATSDLFISMTIV